MKNFIIFALSIFLVGLVSAGCCFDAGNGVCSDNADRTNCEGEGGRYSNNACSFVSDCSSGCCVLGSSAQYITERECEIVANSQGFTKDFRALSEETCSTLANSQIEGACVYEGNYENDCAYVAQGQCIGGEFYENRLCSEEEFNTNCVQLNRTICSSSGDVYYMDSCGNLDALVNDCDYDSGTVCAIRNPTEAYCKSLNCDDINRSNGEKWCEFDENIYHDINELYALEKYSAVGRISEGVGSRFVSKYCLDGEVYVEPCADYRQEFCSQGACIRNPWEECLALNTEEMDPATGLMTNEEECTSMKHCGVFRATDCVENAAGESLCGTERNNRGSYPEFSGEVSESASLLLEDLRLTLCTPRITPGAKISSNIKSTTEQNTVCSAGNLERETTFDNEKHLDKWIITSGNGDEYGGSIGNPGIYSLERGDWIYFFSGFTSTSPTSSNPIWPYFNTYDSPQDSMLSGIYSLAANGDIPHPVVDMLLKQRCAAIGDCVGNSNWAGSLGGGEATSTFSCSKDSEDKMSCDYSFQCSPYIPPTGDSECSACGADNLTCSEYRCKSLGRDCEYGEPAGANIGYCYSENDYDAPTTNIEIYVNGTRYNGSSQIPYNMPIDIKLISNEDALCKLDVGTSGNPFDSMAHYIGMEFGRTHEFRLMYPGQDSYDDGIYELGILGASGSVDLYIRCKDIPGNAPISPRLIVLDIGEAPDHLPPLAQQNSFTPAHNSFVPVNTSTIEVGFELDEDAQCKWSTTDEDYDLMNGNFLCWNTNCSGLLPLDSSSNNFYIRCQDSRGNINSASTNYILKRAATELNIESILPTDITTTENHIELELETVVSGGAGDEICEFKIDESYNQYVEFLQNTGNKHSQNLDLALGNHIVRVHCYDSSGDSDTDVQVIRINQDLISPTITRIYRQGNNLILRTKENSQCKYDYFSCSQKFDSMKPLAGDGLKHSTSGIEGKKYYIKCKDSLGNIPGENVCSRIIRG